MDDDRGIEREFGLDLIATAPSVPYEVTTEDRKHYTVTNPSEFPTGTQLFAKAMEDAESATISLAPAGKAIEAQLDVLCRNAREASVLAAQLQRVTEVLRQIIEKEKQKPGPGDLAAVLTAGVFHQQDARVLGSWPIDRAFLDNLAGKSR